MWREGNVCGNADEDVGHQVTEGESRSDQSLTACGPILMHFLSPRLRVAHHEVARSLGLGLTRKCRRLASPLLTYHGSPQAQGTYRTQTLCVKRISFSLLTVSHVILNDRENKEKMNQSLSERLPLRGYFLFIAGSQRLSN